MMKLRRLADPQVSPDGSRVAFALTEVDLAGGKRNTDLWLVPVGGGRAAADHRRAPPRTRARGGARTGARIAFLSARDGSSQVWALDLAGGEPRKLTSLATGADALRVDRREAPARGRRGLPGLRRRRRVQREGARPRRASPPRPAPTTTSSSATGTRGTTGGATTSSWCRSTGGAAIDLTPGGDDAPPFSLGGEDWSVSPDGQEACFSRKDRKDEAWSTNADVFVVPTAGGAPKRVSEARGLRRRLPLQPGRRPPRLALAAAGRLRGRPLAARGPRPQDRREADADGVPRPRRSSRSPSRPTRRRSTSPPRRRAARTSSPSPRRAERSRPCSAAARSATSRSCPTARRSSARGRAHPPRRDRALRRRREGASRA